MLIYLIIDIRCHNTFLLLDQLLPLFLVPPKHLPSLQIICLLSHFVTYCHYSSEVNQQVNCQHKHGEEDLPPPLVEHGIINDL